MAELEGGSSVSFTHRMPSRPREIAASPPDQITPDANAAASDCVSKSGDGLEVFAEQRASRRPKVSVMVITYNHEKYIAQALESVLMQETEYSYEINVIEDCSTDKTQEIILRYKERFPDRINTYFSSKNIGTLSPPAQKVFYEGFKTLRGDYLAILEGDDYWTSPQKLQKQVDFLEANPDFAICAHNTVKIYEDGRLDPHRFLYWGRRADATVEDVIRLQSFFHTTGVLYRNVFKGVPPRHYRSKWSCDIFVMISHAAYGKVHHIDEDMAVYRAHAGGQFSGMPLLDGWFFNIDGLRRYNAWLGYRYMRPFSQSISTYCQHVLKSQGKDGVARLNPYQFAKILALWACYRSIFHVLSLPKNVARIAKRMALAAKLLALTAKLLARTANKQLARLALRRARLSELPRLEGSVNWDLVWGLNVKTVEGQRVVPDHPVLRLTAVHTRDRAEQDRHALSECIGGLAPGGTYRVTLWVKPVDGSVNVQLQLRDSVHAETGTPGNEGEVRYSLAYSSVLMVNGLFLPGIQPDRDGWQKVSANITTDDGKIFVYLGLMRQADNTHVFRGDGERLLFGGIEISPRPLA